jgi:hypothetical protein
MVSIDTFLSVGRNEHHWMLSLQFGELAALRGVVRQLIVGEYRTGNNIRSHTNSFPQREMTMKAVPIPSNNPDRVWRLLAMWCRPATDCAPRISRT